MSETRHETTNEQQEQDLETTENVQGQVQVLSRDASLRPWWYQVARTIGYVLVGVLCIPVVPILLFAAVIGCALYELGEDVVDGAVALLRRETGAV